MHFAHFLQPHKATQSQTKKSKRPQPSQHTKTADEWTDNQRQKKNNEGIKAGFRVPGR